MKTGLSVDSLLRVARWEHEMPWLWHGFSTRMGGVSVAYGAENEARGDLNLGFTAEDEAERVGENRRRLAAMATGSAETRLAVIRQIHSGISVELRAGEPLWSEAPQADGVLSDQAGVLLAVQTADCIPVLVADRKRRVVAAFHAGWRGTVKRIVETGIGRMRLEFGSRPEDLTAAIGPGIGACCYSVGDEVLSEFESQFAYARELFHEVDSADEVRRKYPMLFLTQRAPGHSPMGPFPHVDLAEANRRQLLDTGLKAAAIHVVGGCTSCDRELFFSHRASQGHAGRMLSVIGICPRSRD